MKRVSLFVAFAISLITNAQNLTQPLPQLPLDPNVRTGKLENGLTYYIRHNEWPEQRADFYIAQKVGSINEEDNQRGLAHFLEHMCFNGTSHFPGNTLKTYLERIGVKFGENLNAYTSFDETVYNINNVPVISNPQSIDSCLLILHDWSNDLLLEGKEIDKERGVINEEWRLRSSADQRMYEKALPELCEGSKYAYRMPIGTMDIVMNFPYDDLRQYYKKWYRPDLQAIIVVGDVDVDAIENKIKQVFGDIKKVENAAVREYFPVPDNTDPIISIQKDKEQTLSAINILWKHEAMPREIRNSVLYYQYDYIIDAINSMMGTRLSELLQKENPPFLSAGFSYNDDYLVSKTKDACIGGASFKDNGHKEALAALYREILRIKRFGFTESEYERYKEKFKANIENLYEKRDKTPNTTYVNEYVRLFLDNIPAPGIEWEHTNLIPICEQTPLQAINSTVMQEEKCAPVVVAFFPEKESIIYPDKNELLNILKEVEGEDIEAYTDSISEGPLLDITKLKGSKTKKTENSYYDFTKYTLKNGIQVFVKKTDFTPNNIAMIARSHGGSSLYDNEEFLNVSNASCITLGGWGNLSAIDLSKKLAGKNVKIKPEISSRFETISGECVKKDFESMLQLAYLAFTSPRKDDEVYKSTMQRTKAALANRDLEPTTALVDSIASVIYKNNVRAVRTKAEDIDKLDYDKLIQIYKERFADGNDFKFFFIGDIDVETALPFIEKYIGSLPTLKGEENSKKIDLAMTKGDIKNIFEKKQENPMAIVIDLYHSPMDYSLTNSLKVDFLKQILQIILTETVREDEGGAYSIHVQGMLNDYPEKNGFIEIQLPTAPDKREKMTEIIHKEIDKIVEEGPSEEILQKVKEYVLRSYDETIKTNGFWLNAIIYKIIEDKDIVNGYTEAVNSITKEDIQETARTIFRSGNHIELGMTAPKE